MNILFDSDFVAANRHICLILAESLGIGLDDINTYSGHRKFAFEINDSFR